MSKADDIRKESKAQHDTAVENIRALSDRVLGEEAARILGDAAGHDFHGNQYTAGGESGTPHEYHAERTGLMRPSKPDTSKNEHVDFKGRPVKSGDKKAFSNPDASDKWSNDLRAKGWNVVQKNTTVGFFNQHANTPNNYPHKAKIDGRLSRKGE